MAKQPRKIILQAAITGAIHTPTMSPYLPAGVDGIADEAIAAANAGASIVHIHNREDNGRPSADKVKMGQILSKIKAATNVVVGISTGGGLGMSVEDRLSVIPDFKPEMASFNSGSINFVLSDLAKNMTPLHDWEIPYLEGTYNNIFRNTFKEMEYALGLMNDAGTLPEFEIFDLGQINNIVYFYKKGLIKKPLYFQFVPGCLGGVPMTAENIMFMVQTLRKEFGEDVMFSMVAGGRRQMRFETLSAVLGGNCRVGLEDSIFTGAKGELAKSNAEQITKMREILDLLDFQVATPEETREMLQLKGKDKVNY